MFNIGSNNSWKEEMRAYKEQYEILAKEVADMRQDWEEFSDWKKMKEANKDAAVKVGSFFLPVDDNALFERLIQEINKDPDLAVILSTAQGTTVSLRSHPQPRTFYTTTLKEYNKGE